MSTSSKFFDRCLLYVEGSCEADEVNTEVEVLCRPESFDEMVRATSDRDTSTRAWSVLNKWSLCENNIDMMMLWGLARVVWVADVADVPVDVFVCVLRRANNDQVDEFRNRLNSELRSNDTRRLRNAMAVMSKVVDMHGRELVDCIMRCVVCGECLLVQAAIYAAVQLNLRTVDIIVAVCSVLNSGDDGVTRAALHYLTLNLDAWKDDGVFAVAVVNSLSIIVNVSSYEVAGLAAQLIATTASDSAVMDRVLDFLDSSVVGGVVWLEMILAFLDSANGHSLVRIWNLICGRREEIEAIAYSGCCVSAAVAAIVLKFIAEYEIDV